MAGVWLKLTLGALGVALIPALAQAAPASASPTSFLDALDARPTPYRTIFGALDAGRGACQIMAAGNVATAVASVTKAIDFVWYRTNVTTSRFHAIGIVNSAAHELCPDQLPKLYAHMHQP
jgi:hypothetical protein